MSDVFGEVYAENQPLLQAQAAEYAAYTATFVD